MSLLLDLVDMGALQFIPQGMYLPIGILVSMWFFKHILMLLGGLIGNSAIAHSRTVSVTAVLLALND